MNMKSRKKAKAGRPITRQIKLDATPEEVMQAVFRAAQPADPSKRKHEPRNEDNPNP